jgi:outer membrane protein assembly factor BamB
MGCARNLLPSRERFLIPGRFAWTAGLGLALLLFPRPAHAVITLLTPLRAVLQDEQLIFRAKITDLAASRPGMRLALDRNLKGKPPFGTLLVSLAGDNQGQKEREQLLKRLAKDLPLVVFASQSGKGYIAFGYSNGTWFQMVGEGTRWRFTHCEPYLRRTFKGTTADMCKTIVDGLAGAKAPPDPDPKVEPGFGPEVPPAPKPEKKSGVSCHGPFFAVIPTFVVIGPVALLAALFPAVFGGLALFLRRWTVLLAALSLGSTLYFLHSWFNGWLQETWWGSAQGLWIALALVSLAGMAWSWARHRNAVAQGGSEVKRLRRGDEFVLHLLSCACVGVAVYYWAKGDHFRLIWKQVLLALAIPVWAGSLYALYLRFSAGRGIRSPILSAESVMLTAMAIACLGFSATQSPSPIEAVPVTDSDSGSPSAEPAAKLLSVKWVFRPKDRGSITSSPLVDGDFVYIGTAHQRGFSQRGGLYCLDRHTGKEHWVFDAGGEMKPVFSSPCVSEGRLYVGEGFHQDSECKLYCINAKDGTKLWDFPTQSHTESSPCVVGGRVFFGAGDDGVYCVDAVTGKERWHFRGLHVDSSPAVVGERVYAGSGYGRPEIFCLDAKTGDLHWRNFVDLPAFASPVVYDGQVFFGIGTGDLLTSSDSPAGALLCVDSKDGNIVWRFNVSDGVHGKPAVDGRRVFFGSRDGTLYCVSQADGLLQWKQDLGSPVVTSPALARPSSQRSSAVYAIATEGAVCCFSPASGHVDWKLNVGDASQGKAQLVSSPALATDRIEERERHWLYFGVWLNDPLSSTAAVYCLEDELAEP